VTWAASNALDHKRLRYKLTFDRDVTRTLLEGFGAAAGWNEFAGNESGIAADTTHFREGTAALKWDKTNTSTTTSGVNSGYWTSTATAQDWSGYDAFEVDARCTGTADLNTSSGFTLAIGTDAMVAANYWQWPVDHAGWSRFTATRTSPTITSTAASWTSVTAWGVYWKCTATSDVFTGYTVDALYGCVLGTALPVFANGTMQNATSTGVVNAIKKVSPLVGTVQPNQASRAARTLTVELVDIDAQVTQMINSYEMRNRVATLSVGFDDVDEADFVTLFKGQVSGMTYKEGVWTLSIGDLKRTLKTTVFSAAATTPVTFTAWNPIDLLLYLWSNGNYADIDPALIDWDGIYAIRDSYFAALTMTFDIREPWELKQFTEEQLIGPLGCYLISTAAGLLTLKYVTTPVYADKTGTVLNASNIIGTPSLEYGLRDLLNEVFWEVDFAAATGEYSTRTMYVDSTSLTAFAQAKRLTVSSQGLDSGDSTFITARNVRLFGRFAQPYPRYKVKTTLAMQTIEEGDVIQFMHPTLADVSTGSRGIVDAHIVEVVSASVNLDQGYCEFELLDTPWSFTKTVVISDLSTDYDASSAADHVVYGWIGRAADNKVGAALDDGYLVLEG
jgi:hypothetical protein